MSDMTTSITFQRSIRAGVLGSIIAGIVFGILMQMMGMIPMIAGMMGSSSLFVGWMIHMVISIIFGIGFGIIARKTRAIYLAAALYGVALWIVGPLIIMPMMMGMGTNLAQAFAPDQLMSLMTHILFAIILAVVYKKII